MSSYFDDASLVMIPSGYKTSKVYSVKPTDGSGDLTFSRSNDTATRVNSAGLIEKVRTNLILQSQTFDNAIWGKLNSATVTANTSVAPDGTTTADTLTLTTNTSSSIYQPITTISELTFSVYAKVASGTKNFRLRFDRPSAIESADFTATTTWQRFTFTATMTGNGNVYILNDSTGTAGDLIIWGAQVETGPVATDYIATTSAAVSVGPVANVPRLDYLGSSCPRLLLEPQRQNVITFSEQMDNASWIKLNGSVTANAGVSPDGYTNADKFVPNTTSGVHALRSNLFNQSATAAHSWFVKADGYSKVAVRESELVGNYASFNLATGTLISTNQTGSIVNYGNGWYRLTLVDTTTGANAQTSIVVLPDSYTTGDPLINWSGDGTKGVLAYGVQVELGAYATSYIPTLGATVTRGADAASKTGISSLIGQTEGTLFVDFIYQSTGNETNRFSLSDGSSANWIFIGQPENGSLRTNRFYIKTNNVVHVDVGSYSTGSPYYVVGQRYKLALAYKSGSWAVYGNGTLLYSGTDSIAAVSSPLSVYNFMQASGGSIEAAESINQTLLFKTRLSNADLAALTTN